VAAGTIPSLRFPLERTNPVCLHKAQAGRALSILPAPMTEKPGGGIGALSFNRGEQFLLSKVSLFFLL
jgi:hypothetical protein